MDATKINKIPKIETVHHNEMYCAFIDVLGYSALVSDEKISVGAKIKKLKSIYENLAANIAPIINEINNSSTSNIYIKSFSDCFYLESSDIHPILIAVNRLFNWTFGYYKNFSFEEEWTPLLRAGIVKDWTLRFKDIGAIVNDTVGENPVGYGVARAYGVSEKSGLSGMRIIISPEVIADLNLLYS